MYMTDSKRKRLAKMLNVDYRQIARTMYSTKTATVAVESNYMPVGINENVTLKEVNVNKTPNGRDFLEIIFENENGQTASMTEWKNEKNQWIVTDEDLQKRDNQQFGRLLQVIDAFKGHHDEFEGNSFVEMINWVDSQLVNENEPFNTVRLKVVYDKKGFTKVSTLGIFIEPTGVTESQIKLWKNDLLERPVQPDKEDDPLASPTTSTPVTETTGADDLPF